MKMTIRRTVWCRRFPFQHDDHWSMLNTQLRDAVDHHFLDYLADGSFC